MSNSSVLEKKEGDNDKQLIFCKGCHKFKPIKGAIWDLIFRGFVCKDCYNKLLKTFDKGENNET